MYWIQKYSQVSPVAGSSLKSFKRVACTDGELLSGQAALKSVSVRI